MLTPWWDTKLRLFNGSHLLLGVSHKGRMAASIEIAACKERIKRGEATRIEIESVSPHGAIYVDELRKEARCP